MTVSREGRLSTAWGRIVGPEASAAENAGTIGTGLLGMLLAPRIAGCKRHTRPERLEAITLGALGWDLWGGAWANNTCSCVRWYERPGQGRAQHMKFAAGHLHPYLIAWYDRADTRALPWWLWASAHYGYLVAATWAVRQAPPGTRRAAGVAATAGGLGLSRLLGHSETAPWFAPIFYAKLLLGHASGAIWPGETRQPLGSTVPEVDR